MADAPVGTLRIGKSQGCVQYYHRPDKECGNGKYIRKDNLELAKRLAQKSYDEDVYNLAKKRLYQINRILSDYEDDEIDRLYLNEHPERQKLIMQVEKTYKQHLEEWLAIPYVGKIFEEGTRVIKTDRGMRVRSKSEREIANYFDSIGVKYKYECPLRLNDFGIVYPDFTFLSPYTYKEIYLEHEGMIDDKNYAQSAVRKIEAYGMNGIHIGDRLLLTFESSHTVLNMELLKELTKRYIIDN